MTQKSLFVKRAFFPAGSTIFKAGDSRDHAYIIESGEVLITAGIKAEHEVHATIGAGELFGESAILEDGKRTGTARAIQDTNVFVLSRDILKERMSALDPLVSLVVSMLIEKYRLSRQVQAEIETAQDAARTALSRQNTALIASYEEQKITALKELQIEQELRRGLENREFKPYLQPIVEFKTGRIVGFETLIRWHHPEKGVIFPNHFIPVAERTNVIQLIDQRMLEAACEIIPAMHKMLGKQAGDMFISVNLSGANFDSDEVVKMVRKVVRGAPFDPMQIKLEITESALVGDSNRAADILSNLKKLGVSIALDDFGTGYSSLGYLHKFSIDGLKIDRSFVQQIHDSEKSLDIIRAVVGLAKAFKLGIIAEGIEEQRDIDVLRDLGCQYGQGYHFGKPIEATEALRLLKASGGMISADHPMVAAIPLAQAKAVPV